MVCPSTVRGTPQKGMTRFLDWPLVDTTLVLVGLPSTAILQVASPQRSVLAHCLVIPQMKTPPPAREHSYSTARARKTPPMERSHYLTTPLAWPIRLSVTLRLRRIPQAL